MAYLTIFKIQYRQSIVWMLLLLINFFSLQAQKDFSLEQCRAMARNTFSAELQGGQIEQVAVLQQQLLKKMITPDLLGYAYGAYLSEVPDPAAALDYAFDMTAAPHERFNAGLFLSQRLYDGGEYRLKKEGIRLERDIEMQKMEEALLQIDQLVDDVFFAVLLVDKGLEVLATQREVVERVVNNTRLLVDEGKLMTKELLHAELALIDVESHRGELEAEGGKYRRMLSVLIGEDVGSDDRLVEPVCADQRAEFVDPGLLQLDLQLKKIDLNRSLSRTAALPHVQLFGTVGYGKPGLNLFKNQFDWYGAIGVMLQVPISGWKDHAREKKLLQVEWDRLHTYRHNLQRRREVMEADRSGEVYRYEMLERQQAVALAKLGQIRAQMEVLFFEGEVSLTDYLTALGEESAARMKLQGYALRKKQEMMRRNRIVVNHLNDLEK